jgi:hypothetical protein
MGKPTRQSITAFGAVPPTMRILGLELNLATVAAQAGWSSS